MYMRLWWKDARQFWPIWAFLVLAAGVTQLLVHALSEPARCARALLGVAGDGLDGLYAFAVGAAAFAGERETGTLRLLDLLPASRPVVWAGKVSFAFVTTMALAGDPPGPGRDRCARGPRLAVGRTGSDARRLMLQGLAWGLLCSAILGSALLAAVAARAHDDRRS